MTFLDVQIPVSYVLPSDVQEGDLPPADDPFFYGWREVLQRTNGTEEWVPVPLTLADVLHPQLGDHVVQSLQHDDACDTLKLGLKGHLAHEPQTLVMRDVGIDWGIDGIKPVGPDIAVVRETTASLPLSLLSLTRYGGRVDLVVEVTSNATWKVDVDGFRTPNKWQLYERFGIPYYIIVEMRTYRRGRVPRITVYRLSADGRYEQDTPDERGWFWIASVGLWIGPYEDWVSWYDADGTKIGTYVEVNESRKHEAEARKVAEERAQYETEARQRAEEQARTEAEARQRAEEQARTEAEARQQAEEQARSEAEARQQAEERIRELEALLRTTGGE